MKFFIFNKFINNKYINNFIKKILILFNSKNTSNNSQILVEFNGWSIIHIVYAYVANVLKKKYNANIIGYEGYTLIASPIKINFYQKIKWILGWLFGLRYFGVYKSFGAKKIVRPIISNSIDIESLKITKKFFSENLDKNRLLKLKIKNILIGDLIYDTYLKIYKKGTVNFTDKKFEKLFLESVKVLLFWIRYFKENNVKAVCVSHTVYVLGIPGRVGNYFGSKVYNPIPSNIYKLSKNNQFAGNSHIHYKKEFNKLDKIEKKQAFKIADQKLNSILKKLPEKKIFNKKKNILIACHCFFDSPHLHGDMLFADFYEWLIFLSKISWETNYNWYIKPHSNQINENTEIISKLSKKFKNSKIIKTNNIFKTIKKEKIDVILTCYGSISYEAAFKNYIVINSSKNNPHMNYNFSYTPKSLNDYKNKLMNLDKFKMKINKNEIKEFFYMRFLYDIQNWIFLNNPIIKRDGFGLTQNVYDDQIYNKWIEFINYKKHYKILNLVKKYLDNKDNIISEKFFKSLDESKNN